MGTVVDVLEARDGWGRTDKGWVSLAYLEAVEGPQRATDTGLAIQEHIISDGRENRPGRDTNPGGNFEAAKANAAALVRLLMEEHGIPLDNVVQHNRWNGKDCPKTIRATAGAWEAFLALCRGETANVSKLDTDVDTLANVGIIDQPDYWKAGNYSKDTVEALIGKTADYVREDD